MLWVLATLGLEHAFEKTRYKSYEFASEEMVKAGCSSYKLVETEESMKRIQVILQDDDEMLSDLNDPVLLASLSESKVATVCYNE
jgi:hypothetical protein